MTRSWLPKTRLFYGVKVELCCKSNGPLPGSNSHQSIMELLVLQHKVIDIFLVAPGSALHRIVAVTRRAPVQMT